MNILNFNKDKIAAWAVHGFTGSGAVLGFLAIISILDNDLTGAFLWLGLALLIDGIDGTIARKIGVTDKTPNIDGSTIDNVIDYLNYVIIPALMVYWFSCNNKKSFWDVTDFGIPLVPIGLALGRIGNFINDELWGRVTQVPWGIVFPGAGPLPRHPSQLYEVLLEGLVLFLVLYFLRRSETLRRRTGLLTGVFFIGYGLARSVAELFRQPDYHIGFLAGGTTMGQWLSAPLILFGIWLIGRAKPGT